MRIDVDPRSLTLLRSPRDQAIALPLEQQSSTAPGQAPGEVEKANKLDKRVAAKVAEAERTAREFESLFLEMMLKSMRSTAMPEEASNAMDIYTGLLDSEYAKSMSGGSQFGVQKFLLDYMKEADPELASVAAPGASAAAGLNRLKLEQYRIQSADLGLKLR